MAARPAERPPTPLVPLLLALAGGALALLWSRSSAGDFLERLELRSLDARFVARGPRQPAEQVVIVVVDDDSLQAIGPWPWPRRHFALLTEKLVRAGARAVAFDILFFEPDQRPGGAQSDAALAAAGRVAGRVFHGAADAGDNPQAAGVVPARQPTLERFALTGAQVVTVPGLAGRASLRQLSGVLAPLPSLLATSRGIGFVDVPPSLDGVYRNYLPVVEWQGKLYPSLATALAMDALGVTGDQVSVEVGRCVRLGGTRQVPTDRAGMMLIDFAGGAGTFPRYPAHKVLTDAADVPRDAFRDKIVLVAVTATGLYDLRASPFDPMSNGVEIQANALSNMLQGRFLRKQRPETVLTYTLAWTLILGIFLPRLGAVGQVILSATLVLLHNLLAVWQFNHRGIAMVMVTPTLGIGLAIAFVVAYRLIVQERRHTQLQNTFSRFVPPEVAQGLTGEDLSGLPHGERRVVTVLFADLRGFTSASARMAPEDALALLNRYFQLMHEVILRFDGTLDKFVGDEMMAFWNAPREQVDHAALAVAAAVEMQRQIESRRDEWEYLGMPDLAACAGLNTGEVVVGYVGSGERMQYTVIGVQVNLASRLEMLAKELGARTLISRSTFELVKHVAHCTPRGRFKLHGIEEEVEVFEVMGMAAQQGSER